MLVMQTHTSGMWEGSRNGKTGYFPASNVEFIGEKDMGFYKEANKLSRVTGKQDFKGIVSYVYGVIIH